MKKGFFIPLYPEEFLQFRELSHRECGKLLVIFWEYYLKGKPCMQLSEDGNEWLEKLLKRAGLSNNINKINAGVRECDAGARGESECACEASPVVSEARECAPAAPLSTAGAVSNYVVQSDNLELSTDLELCTHNNNNSDDKSSTTKTTTTTVCYSARTRKNVENFEHTEKNVENFGEYESDQWTESIELEIMSYFHKREYISSPLDFIAYNQSRNWRGIGGEDVREDYTRYADRWEAEERRKRGEYDWTPPII